MIGKKQSLQEFLQEIGDYKLIRNIPLGENVKETLELDDYLLADYRGPNGSVNLYIGYYFSAAKMSAAHSPLVCLPAQGWSVDEPVMKQLTVGGNVINYAEIEASIQGKTDLVLYWYQSAQITSPHVFRNKVNTFYNKFTQDGEQHAFVRVTVLLAGGKQDVNRLALDFIQDFYPEFIEYIGSDNTTVMP